MNHPNDRLRYFLPPNSSSAAARQRLLVQARELDERINDIDRRMLDPEFAALIAREGPKDEPQAFDPGSIHQFYKMQLILARMIYEGLEEYENCTRCVQLLKRIDLLAPAEP